MSSYNRRINLYINGKEVKNDMASIRKEMIKLTSEQNRMTRGSAEYNEKTRQIRYLKGLMKEHREELNKTEKKWFSLGRAADGFNKFAGFFTAIAASLGGVVIGFKKTIDMANQFEERVDNLSALTGLMGDELEWLSDTAKKTSVATVEGNIKIKQSADDIVDAYTKVGSQRPELLKNKEALHGVTTDAIILSEAAKSDLAPAVAGLTMAMNQFGLEADNSKRIINTLAAGSKEGAADIPYLTQAMEKSGTTSRLMGIEIEQWAGAIESVAPFYSQASTAGNSFDKVLLKMKANQIGYVNGQFDLNRALEELETRFKNGETAEKLFGVEHAKMGELLVANRHEVDRYTEAVTGTSVALEQAAKNTNNNAAKLAQAQNKFKLIGIQLGETLAPIMTFSTNTVSYVIKATVKAIDFFTKYGKTITQVGLAIGTYTVLVKAKWLWEQKSLLTQKALGLLQSKNIIVQKAGIVLLKAQTLLNGKLTFAQKKQMLATKGAMAAQKGLNAAMKSNMIMLLVTGLVMLVQHLVKLNKEAVKARINTKELNAEIAKESQETNNLFDVLKKTVPGGKEYNDAKEQLIKLYPDLLSHYDLEKGSLDEIEAAQRAVNNEIIRNVAIRSKQDDLTELAEKANKKFAKSTERILKLADNAEQKGALASMFGRINDEVKNGTKSVGEASKEIAEFLGVSTAMKTVYSQYGSSEVYADGRYGKIVSNLSEIANVNKKFTEAQGEIDTFYTALLGNTTDYKKILGSIDNATSIKELEEYLASEDDKIRKAAEARKVLLEEFNVAKPEIDSAKSLAQLEAYLNSENKLVKEYAEKRKLALEQTGDIKKEKKKDEDDDERLKNLDAAHKRELLNLKKQQMEKLEDDEWYKEEALNAEIEYLEKKLRIQQDLGEETVDTEQALLNKRIEQVEVYRQKREKIDKLFEDLDKDIDNRKKNDYDLEGVKLDTDDEEIGKAVDLMERFKNLKKKFHEEDSYLQSEFELEMQDIEDAHTWGLLAHEDYEKKKAEITREYAIKRIAEESKYLDAAESILYAFNDMYTAQKDAELEKAGDDAAEKERIEKKYAEKQKKIAIGQALISGALAIIKLWATESVMPSPLNEIYKGIMTAAIAGTTAAQVGKIQSQQFYSGGYTGGKSKYKAAGIVHEDEFVATQESVNNPTIRPILDILDFAQKSGTAATVNFPEVSRSISTGFSGGGYTSNSTANTTSGNSNSSDYSEMKKVMMLMAQAAETLAKKQLNVNIKRFSDEYEKYNRMQDDVDM